MQRPSQQNSNDYLGYRMADRQDIGDLRIRLSVVEKGLVDIQTTLNHLTTKFDKRNETPWTAYGVILAALISLGGALYYPMLKDTEKNTTRVERIEQQYLEDLRQANRDLRNDVRRRLFNDGRTALAPDRTEIPRNKGDKGDET